MVLAVVSSVATACAADDERGPPYEVLAVGTCPFNLVLHENQLFWTNGTCTSASASLNRMDLDGGNSQSLIGRAHIAGIFPDGDFVYWGQRGTGEIHRLSTTTGTYFP